MGIKEFRSDFTTSWEDYALLVSYDNGRDFAHALMLRIFDQATE